MHTLCDRVTETTRDRMWRCFDDKGIHIEKLHSFLENRVFSQAKRSDLSRRFCNEEPRVRTGVRVVGLLLRADTCADWGDGSATSFPTRAVDSVSDSVSHSCSCFRCARRSVSTCPPRGNLVDGLPRAPSFRHKNASCSESVSSIDVGTIFPPRLWHYLWDTVFLVSSLSF